MPELPEVEVVARHLRAILPERVVEAVEVLRPRLVTEISPERFCKRLEGARFTTVGRRGKHVLLHLNSGDTLIVHLRMSGRFFYLDAAVEHPRFTHAIFRLDNGKNLLFQDQRHFGMMHLVRSGELDTTDELKKLAPEPFSAEFTSAYLAGVLAGTSRSLKETLLDQTKVLGLGNIYAAEAMFRARLHPALPARDVPKKAIPKLYAAIRDILGAAIEAGSTVNGDPTVIDGRYFGSSFEDELTVYDREGEPCRRCRTPIARIRQGQRSTYFCPKCQSSQRLSAAP